MPKSVDRKHNWAEKDWAENKSGPKSDQPKILSTETETMSLCH